MAIRTNTNPREMDLQPEMQKILMRNGMQVHVVSDGSGFRLVVQGHDSPLLTYAITERQMLALTAWGSNTANKKAYNVFTSIIGNDFHLPKNFVHARNANGRVAMGLHGYRDISGGSLDTLSVRLKKCNGLTRGGLPIIFYEGLYGDYIPTATLPDSNPSAIEDNVFLILVSINPYEMIPIGEPDPEVIPLHHPHVLPSIKLHIMPKSQTNKAFYSKNFLIIGEIKSHGNAFAVNRQYIPPLQKSAYHDGLKSFINQLTHILHNIREDIRTIYSRNLSDKRRDALANNTFVLCNAFSSFYNSRIFFIEQTAQEQPPIFLIQAINELANGFVSALQTLSETMREELLQYYYEWTNITPSDFMHSIEKVTGITYEHTDISSSLHTLGTFLSLLERMFHKMGELEYIGLVRENIVVGEESTTSPQEEKKKKWSFM